ncbi:MAG: hypothetical protein ACRBI6_03145 [Acidimicrobiales bacterium]
MDKLITTASNTATTITATSRSGAASNAAFELVVLGAASASAASAAAVTVPGLSFAAACTMAAFAATAMALASMATAFGDVQGNTYANGRGIAPISFRPFLSGSWHCTTTEKKKGHSQRERCT